MMKKVHPQDMEPVMEPVMEEKVETVDLEALDARGDIFAREYGAETMAQAQKANQERLSRVTDKTRKHHTVDPGLKVGTNARLSYFENEKLYENDWKNSTLDLVEEILLQCNESSEAHVKAAKACRRNHRLMMIPSIILATAATSASFFAAGDNPCGASGATNDDESLKYVVASLTALVGVMSGIASVYNFKAKMSDHVSAAGAFANLARRSKIIVFLPTHLKPNAEVALTDISAEQAHLTNTSPLL